MKKKRNVIETLFLPQQWKQIESQFHFPMEKAQAPNKWV